MLRLLKLLAVNAAVKLDGLKADPLLCDDRNDVVATHHLATLLPHVVNTKVDIRHTCAQSTVLIIIDNSTEGSIIMYTYVVFAKNFQKFLVRFGERTIHTCVLDTNL